MAGTARSGGQGRSRHRRGRCIAARSVLDGREHGASLAAGRAATFPGRAGNSVAGGQGTRGGVTSNAARLMENCQTAAGVAAHLHHRLPEVWTQRAFRNLKLAAFERDAIVVADDAFLLNAQDSRQISNLPMKRLVL